MSIFSKDPENTEAADLQRKLEMLNNMMDQEARAEQARRQILYNIGHCKYSPSHCLSGCCFIRNNSSLCNTRGRPRSIVSAKKKKREKKNSPIRRHLALKFHFTFQCLYHHRLYISGMFLVRDGIGSFRWLNYHHYSTFLWIIDNI